MEEQPLSDLRIIDLTHCIAGPYCTKLLADYGADVIKVERPGSGDYARALGPFPGDEPHPEKSGLFLFLNTNKRSVTLDLKTPEGVDAVKSLVRDADVLVESFRPGVMARLGLDYDALKAINPGLVMTSVSNFGQTGPYRDYKASELTLFGMGNSMTRLGLPDRYPLKLGGNHVQYQAGNNAAMATMFAWYAQKHRGMGGQYVDVSIHDTQMGSINGRMMTIISYQYNGMRGRRLGTGVIGYPNGVYPCKDGYISVAGGGQRFPRVAASLGRPELVEHPRYGVAKGAQDSAFKEEFETTIWIPWLMQRTKEEVVQECQASELLCTPYNTIDEVVDNNPQLDFREYFTEIDHPVAGKLKYPGSPVFTKDNWWRIRRPAPLLGQHTEEVLNETAAPRQRSAVAPATPGGSSGAELPLEDIRIADLTVVLAGPYGTMFLGDLGAQVVRVETLQQLSATSRGQFARPSREAEANAPMSMYPDKDPGERPWNRYAGFNAHGRNKYGITVDLRTPEGKDVFRKLIEMSDLFIENNAVGSIARLGFTYDVVSEWNPRLIMISITGFGQTGPWAAYRGIGTSFEAAYGHASVMGYPDMGPEGVPLTVPADACTGVTVAMAATIALHQREKTGRGAFIDISLGENFLPHLGELFMDYTINGRVAGSPGNRDQWALVQGAYPCAGDDEWVAISIGKQEQWATLCRLMNRPGLADDPRFESMAALREHHDEVDRIIGEWTADKEPVALFHELQRAGVVAGYLMHDAHALNDPHVRERGVLTQVTHPEIGTHLYPGLTFKMSGMEFKVRKPAVRLGEDNDFIYREVLRLTEDEYDNLKAKGHIGMDYADHVR